MTMLARKPQRVKPLRRGDQDEVAMIESEGYEVVYQMQGQRVDLEAIRVLDDAGDVVRERLRRNLRAIQRAVVENDRPLALRLLQVSLVLLHQVDDLDRAEHEDPVDESCRHNHQAAESGRRIIALTGERDEVA